MSKLAMAEPPIGIFIQNHLRPLPRPEDRVDGIGRGLVRMVCQATTTGPGRSSASGPNPIKNPLATMVERYGSFIQDRTGILLRSQPGGEYHVVVGLSAFGNDLPQIAPDRHRDFEGIPKTTSRTSSTTTRANC
ncbi:MAG: hypothetical protein R3D52_15290 [Xanthobacteraceae bacterium]